MLKTPSQNSKPTPRESIINWNSEVILQLQTKTIAEELRISDENQTLIELALKNLTAIKAAVAKNLDEFVRALVRVIYTYQNSLVTDNEKPLASLEGLLWSIVPLVAVQGESVASLITSLFPTPAGDKNIKIIEELIGKLNQFQLKNGAKTNNDENLVKLVDAFFERLPSDAKRGSSIGRKVNATNELISKLEGIILSAEDKNNDAVSANIKEVAELIKPLFSIPRDGVVVKLDQTITALINKLLPPVIKNNTEAASSAAKMESISSESDSLLHNGDDDDEFSFHYADDVLEFVSEVGTDSSSRSKSVSTAASASSTATTGEILVQMAHEQPAAITPSAAQNERCNTSDSRSASSSSSRHFDPPTLPKPPNTKPPQYLLNARNAVNDAGNRSAAVSTNTSSGITDEDSVSSHSRRRRRRRNTTNEPKSLTNENSFESCGKVFTGNTRGFFRHLSTLNQDLASPETSDDEKEQTSVPRVGRSGPPATE